MTKRLRITRKFLVVVAFLFPLIGWAEGPFDGRWKVVRGISDPETFVLQNGEYACSTCNEKLSVKADGLDHPAGGTVATLAVTIVSDNAVLFIWKRNGKVIGEYTETVSSDGSTLTKRFKDATDVTTRTRTSPGPSGAHAISGSWQRKPKVDFSQLGVVITFKSRGDTVTCVWELGSEPLMSYEAKFDSNDYPVRDGFLDSVSLSKVNGNVFVETHKKQGRPVTVNEVTVNGQRMEIVSKDLLAGLTMRWTAEKQ